MTNTCFYIGLAYSATFIILIALVFSTYRQKIKENKNLHDNES